MKKTVLTLAVASCFALGFSMAQASSHAHEHSTADDHGHAAASGGPYMGHTDITGQTQNVKIGADGVRLPYNMAQDRPSVSAAQNGVRPVRGAAAPMFVYQNTPKPRIEPNQTWLMSGTNHPNGTSHNDYIHSFGGGYNPR